MIETFLPNDRRGFVHKRLLGAVGGFITGGPTGAVSGFVTSGGGSRGPRMPSGSELSGIRVHAAHGHGAGSHTFMTPANLAAAGVPMGRSLDPRTPSRFAPGSSGPCMWPARVDPNTGRCKVFLGSEPGFDDPMTGSGAAVMGRYGAGMEPVQLQRMHADCTAGGTIRGMVLGNDGICYNKRDLRNAERMWPRGRRPLLTGGEQRAISIASAAAGKLMRSKKRLKKVATTFAKAC